jgi:hypothetical protein
VFAASCLAIAFFARFRASGKLQAWREMENGSYWNLRSEKIFLVGIDGLRGSSCDQARSLWRRWMGRFGKRWNVCKKSAQMHALA